MFRAIENVYHQLCFRRQPPPAPTPTGEPLHTVSTAFAELMQYPRPSRSTYRQHIEVENHHWACERGVSAQDRADFNEVCRAGGIPGLAEQRISMMVWGSWNWER